MLQRVLNRAKTSGRIDDNEGVFRKRYRAFVEQNAEILRFFGDKVIDVRDRQSDATRCFTDSIQVDCERPLDTIYESLRGRVKVERMLILQ